MNLISKSSTTHLISESSTTYFRTITIDAQDPSQLIPQSINTDNSYKLIN